MAGIEEREFCFPDCIHLSQRYRCDILRVAQCVGEGCAFRQSETEYRLAYERWQKAISALSCEQRGKIVSKYYGGKMPHVMQEKK
ncbi:hypothetical protein [Fumia xinanensis]|uniref:Uncharacterized protein n=1 Tax=Fumia xinanensis TaxID=2763659 RepID=A0A926E4Q0_9FIRM|nr:hypothetical protein [Fumia xinanensis]MBC8559495.1 hypothetical protein [Fumia xinanensis]PWL42432.1 MAG: hypothetical protein DBY45_08815 [Clostridiales bacterium]